ncbi:hypothetical protein ALC56_13034 [Trachymyrmex septentrionalis]|uniref:HAT C-terminal dimerisation domain-containing protein n=1 Tax=Trachymyrmex septentrionalis TaxID=34720 RepID=A0A195EWE2_9HYME|nr:hypothetical protein ALC56_13034 [Trachymyrmex septentrionalis]
MGLMNEYLSSDNRMKPNFVIIKNITINFITSYGAKSILLAYKEEEEKSSKSSKRREHARFNFTGEETENLRSGNCNINEFFKKTLNPISLMPAIDRLIYSWPAIKHYFLFKDPDNCHRMLWKFISKDCNNTDLNDKEECTKEDINECYLSFLQNLLPEFSKVILLLESDSYIIIDIDNIIRNLVNQLQSQLDDNFFDSKIRYIFKSITYSKERYYFSPDAIYKKFGFLSLKSDKLKLTWDILCEFPILLNIEEAIDFNSLYSEFTCLKAIFDVLPKDLPNDKIWIHFFRNNNCKDFVNLKKIISFVLSILISNAFCERNFQLA